MNSSFLSAAISLFFASASILSYYSFNGPAWLSGFIGSMCPPAHWGPRGDEAILQETPFLIFPSRITQSGHVLPPKWSGDETTSLSITQNDGGGGWGGLEGTVPSNKKVAGSIPTKHGVRMFSQACVGFVLVGSQQKPTLG